MTRKALCLAGALLACSALALCASKDKAGNPWSERVVKTEEEWKRVLTPEQFGVLRKKGTERAFTGKYHDFHGRGIYVCAGCGTPLFSSEQKFDSGTGWPSFWDPISPEAVVARTDRSWFMKRVEVICRVCGGHLGHVFDDGPPPTNKRYCINSAALKFIAKDEKSGKMP